MDPPIIAKEAPIDDTPIDAHADLASKQEIVGAHEAQTDSEAAVEQPVSSI